MKKYNYKSHILGSVALLTMGNAVITLPFYKTENPLPVFLVSSVLTLLFVLLCVPVTNFAFGYKDGFLKKAVRGIVVALVITAAFYGAVSGAFDYLSFIKEIQMPKTDAVLTTVALLLLCAVFIKCKNEAVLKTGLFLAVLSQGALLLLFAASVKLFDFGEIKFDINITGFDIKGSLKYFIKYFSPLLAATAFVTLTNGRARALNMLGGTALGLFNILIVLIQSIAVLGFATDYDFPYFYAVSAFSAGNLFYRLGGLVYFVFFSASVIKIALCIKAIPLIIKSQKRC